MAKIEIKAKDTAWLPGTKHLYIVYTTNSGEQFSLRGGPKNNNIQGILSSVPFFL